MALIIVHPEGGMTALAGKKGNKEQIGTQTDSTGTVGSFRFGYSWCTTRTNHMLHQPCIGPTIHWTNHTLDQPYTGPTTHWTNHTLDQPYTGPTTHWTNHTLDQPHTGPTIHRTNHVLGLSCTDPVEMSYLWVCCFILNVL